MVHLTRLTRDHCTTGLVDMAESLTIWLVAPGLSDHRPNFAEGTEPATRDPTAMEFGLGPHAEDCGRFETCCAR